MDCKANCMNSKLSHLTNWLMQNIILHDIVWNCTACKRNMFKFIYRGKKLLQVDEYVRMNFKITVEILSGTHKSTSRMYI